MTSATKKKNVFKEVLDSEMVEPEKDQQIVRVLSSKGNNLHEAELPDKTKFLISMPSKFRKNVWIKHGQYVIIDPIKEGNKVKGEICKVLLDSSVKYLKRKNIWPKEFEDIDSCNRNEKPIESPSESSSSSSSDSDS